jgi:hypothetical protein
VVAGLKVLHVLRDVLAALARSQALAAASTAVCRNQLVHGGGALPFAADRRRASHSVCIHA